MQLRNSAAAQLGPVLMMHNYCISFVAPCIKLLGIKQAASIYEQHQVHNVTFMTHI